MKPRVPQIRPEQLLLVGRPPRHAASATLRTAPLRRNFFTSTPTRTTTKATQPSQNLLRRLRFLRLRSDKPQPLNVNPTPQLGSSEPALSLSQRLKQLSREYGWTAVGVYFALSVLDFPFCFLAVRLLGTDRIGHYEDALKNAFWSTVRMAFPNAGKIAQEKTSEELAAATAGEGDISASYAVAKADASIWTQLGLAYLVHKSFIFIRVPLTAAVLPKVVKTLRSWGYNIGKKKPKKA